MPRLDAAEPQPASRQITIQAGGLGSHAAHEAAEATLRKRARKLALMLMAASGCLVFALIAGALLLF